MGDCSLRRIGKFDMHFRLYCRRDLQGNIFPKTLRKNHKHSFATRLDKSAVAQLIQHRIYISW
jgi:hypothetical protein